MEIPGSTNTTLGAVQVNVVDYKPFTNGDDVTSDERAAVQYVSRKLIDNLRTFTTFMTPNEDKVATNLELVDSTGDRLVLNLALGKQDDPFIKRFEIPLPKIYQGRTAPNLHQALKEISTVQPGGNVPNMIRNTIHAMRAGLLPLDMELRLLSTDEPVFQEWFDGLEPVIRDRIRLTTLDVHSRMAIHLPYDSDKPGGVGTLGLVTPMHSTIQGIGENFEQLVECNHVLVSESLAQLVGPSHRRYRELQNPSTAFRQQCPLESYNLMLNQGRIPYISMNEDEMTKYLESIETRRALGGTSPSTGRTSDITTPSFSQPFDDERELNLAAMQSVTDSFNRYFACITPHPENQIYFPVSVSCGPFGGYHIACTSDGKRYVVFSSTPHPKGDGTEKMLNIIGDNDDIKPDKKHTMGAGDSVATILSMAHLWDMEKLIGNMRRKHHPIGSKFIETASMIFASLLSRFAGEILYHSDRCDWMSVPPDIFPQIMETTGRKSLDLASSLWNKVSGSPQVAREPEWDMDVALWQL